MSWENGDHHECRDGSGQGALDHFADHAVIGMPLAGSRPPADTPGDRPGDGMQRGPLTTPGKRSSAARSRTSADWLSAPRRGRDSGKWSSTLTTYRLTPRGAPRARSHQRDAKHSQRQCGDRRIFGVAKVHSDMEVADSVQNTLALVVGNGPFGRAESVRRETVAVRCRQEGASFRVEMSEPHTDRGTRCGDPFRHAYGPRLSD